MKYLKRFDQIVNSPLNRNSRGVLAFICATLVFILGTRRYSRNDFFMGVWERDTSNFWHFMTNFGHTSNLIFQTPTALVGIVSSLIVLFMLMKQVLFYPPKINLHLIILAALDFLVVAILMNIFLFSGTAFELIYYFGAFFAGMYFFGNRVNSQMALLGIAGLVFIRLVFIEGLYVHAFWVPVLILMYLIVRAPFESIEYRNELREFSISKLIGRG